MSFICASSAPGRATPRAPCTRLGDMSSWPAASAAAGSGGWYRRDTTLLRSQYALRRPSGGPGKLQRGVERVGGARAAAAPLHGWPNRACMHANSTNVNRDAGWPLAGAVAWRWAGRWLCGGGLPMGAAHRARASAGLDPHVMAASPSVVRPLWREGRPRSVGSKLAKKKNDDR